MTGRCTSSFCRERARHRSIVQISVCVVAAWSFLNGGSTVSQVRHEIHRHLDQHPSKLKLVEHLHNSANTLDDHEDLPPVQPDSTRHRSRVAATLLQLREKLDLPADLVNGRSDPWTLGGARHFNTTFFPDHDCWSVLYNQTWFRAVGDVFVREWMARHPTGYEWEDVYKWRPQDQQPVPVNLSTWKPNAPSSEELSSAESLWLEALQKCRGLLPLQSPGLEYDAFSGFRYFDSFAREANVVGNRMLNQFSEASLYKKFEIVASCLFHLQFPFTPLPVSPGPGEWWKYPLRVVSPHWKPKRVVVVAMATFTMLGHNLTQPEAVEQLLKKICPFLQTAYERGYEVVVSIGYKKHFVLMDKFRYALKMVQAVLDQNPTIPPEDTVIVFGDAWDVMFQFGPQFLIERFLDQPKPFVWSAGDCTGIDHPLFTTSDERRDWLCYNGGFFPRQYVGGGFHPSDTVQINSGAWIGVLPAVQKLIGSIVQFLDHKEPTDWREFHDKGNMNQHCNSDFDQLFGQVSYVRHRNYVGLDTNAVLFAALGDDPLRDTVHLCGKDVYDDVDGYDGWGNKQHDNNVTDSEGIDESLRRSRYCYGKTVAASDKLYKCNATTFEEYQCPAMLHLYGNGKGLIPEILNSVLTEDEKQGRRTSCRPGSLLFMDMDTNRLLEINELEKKYNVQFPCYKPFFCKDT